MAFAPLVQARAHLVQASNAPMAPAAGRNYAAERRNQREHDQAMNDAAKDRQMADQEFRADQNAHNREHEAGMQGARLGHDAAMQGARFDHDAAMQGARFDHDTAMQDARLGHATEMQNRQDDEWYKRRQYMEQERRREEDVAYGIPEGANLTAQDRARIIQGTHRYGRTDEENQQRSEIERELEARRQRGEFGPVDESYVKEQMTQWDKEHPERAIPKPDADKTPTVYDIGGVPYFNNGGRWQPVDNGGARREEARQNQLDDKRTAYIAGELRRDQRNYDNTSKDIDDGNGNMIPNPNYGKPYDATAAAQRIGETYDAARGAQTQQNGFAGNPQDPFNAIPSAIKGAFAGGEKLDAAGTDAPPPAGDAAKPAQTPAEGTGGAPANRPLTVGEKANMSPEQIRSLSPYQRWGRAN